MIFTTTINIMLPVSPAIIAVFFGVLVVALVYYGIKFVASIITGG